MEVIAKKNTAKRNTVFTSEQLEKAKSLGISKRALYMRVWKGMPAEIACTKPMRTKRKSAWHDEIYALYKGDEFIADGTVFEIAEATGIDVKKLKYYSYDSYKKRSNGNHLIMEFLYREGEDDE